MFLHQLECFLDQVTHIVAVLLRVIHLVSNVHYNIVRMSISAIDYLLFLCLSKFITGRI